MTIQKLFDLSGKTAMISGAGSGIGLAMTTALGLAGARVLLVGRTESKLESAVAGLKKMGVDASFFACDLGRPGKAIDCARKALALFHRIDILVNAAGINLRQPFAKVTPKTWRQQTSLLLEAPFFLTQGLAPRMAENSWGRIINIASLQSCRAFADSAPYGAAKGGLVQLTRATALELSPMGITCNAVGPGFFNTPLTRPVFDDAGLARMHAERTCIGRNGQFEDLYGVTVFLAGDASAYITGQLIMVDGGYTAR